MRDRWNAGPYMQVLGPVHLNLGTDGRYVTEAGDFSRASAPAVDQHECRLERSGGTWKSRGIPPLGSCNPGRHALPKTLSKVLVAVILVDLKVFQTYNWCPESHSMCNPCLIGKRGES